MKRCVSSSHTSPLENILLYRVGRCLRTRAREDRCLQITSTDRHVGLTEVHLRHYRRRHKAIIVRSSAPILVGRLLSTYVYFVTCSQLTLPSTSSRRFLGDRLVEGGIFDFSYAMNLILCGTMQCKTGVTQLCKCAHKCIFVSSLEP